MHNQHSPHIDQATIDRWQADGAVLLKGVFTPWVERLAEGVTALMASPSEYGHARTVIPKDGSPPFFQDYCNWSRIPAFSEFVFQSAAVLLRLRQAERQLLDPAGPGGGGHLAALHSRVASLGGGVQSYPFQWH